MKEVVATFKRIRTNTKTKQYCGTVRVLENHGTSTARAILSEKTFRSRNKELVRLNTLNFRQEMEESFKN